MNFLLGFWRQRNYRMATIVGGLATLWLLSGILLKDEKQALLEAEVAKSTSVLPAERMKISGRYIEAQPYTTRVVVNSRSEANRSVQLRAELDGAVAGLPVDEGQYVAKGDVICEIAAEDRPEKLARARASLKKAELDFAGAQKLKGRGLQSGTQMAQQEVALANARADLKRAQLDVQNLKIRAPFDGVVNSRAVELGDFVRRGEECATILDLNPMLIVGEVSETKVGSLLLGAPANAQMQDGQILSGRLRYVSQQAHAVTRAYRVEVAVANDDGALRSGISARMALPTGEVMAHRINSSLLTLDDAGILAVKILDEDQRVVLRNVRLVSDESDGVWVTGLSPRTLLVTVGQEYVSVGEQVDVELEETGGDLPAPLSAVEPEPEPASVKQAAQASGESL
ncbi:efflux RND transporter periplasmic adaptor subunit [Microbulbifer agarilyticus]|uniref:efflux RND transporter periplasmic adaptor subunit n=1 Tax=Microbulbifer agarilyticus TaxID=260552 RepID=UPI001C960EDA|nr:efflux RND transporter periplasmic adaptor subunit [Microbulbifer agarilyticus]MBY6191658.1 efflux RND transporter periplasmic adaptor subunit [Microbulbifer agarilyticus]MBY6212433.1 efflux RND transporter periplasmic adaptor subunit [Microbulbifer agarilyticus]MCA0894050.1 efflux RND transporter periplasmic adaptor subunit [Microbulbifer agarilyticus]